MKKILLALSILLLITSSAFARPLSINEILEATCRVNAGNAYGSGTCVKEEGDYYLILTNAHVVGNNSSVAVEFFTGGDKTLPVRGQVAWRGFNDRTDVDFAIVAVPKSGFGNFVPRIIPLVPEGYQIQNGQYITSAGCPAARWAVGWEGHIVRDEHSRLLFTPPPEGGQSGSGIHVLVPDEKGELHTRLGAILTWKIGNGGRDQNGYDLSVGGAIPMQTMYGLLRGTHQAKEIPSHYQPVSMVNIGHYAKDKFGIYHQVYSRDDGKMYVRGENVPIIDWYAITPVCNGNCQPRGGCPNCGPNQGRFPLPGPSQPDNPSNPFGNRPPDIGAPPPKNDGKLDELNGKIKDLEDENTELKAQIIRLNQEKLDLINELTTIKNSLGVKEGTIDELKKQLDSITNDLAEYNKVKEQLVDATKEADKLKDLAAEKSKQVDDLNNHITGLVEEYNQKQEEVSSTTTQRNWLAGLLSLLGISGIGIGIWKYFRPTIKSAMDKVEDKIQDKVDDYIDPNTVAGWRKQLDDLETRIGDKIETIIAAKTGSSIPMSTGLGSPVTQVVYNAPAPAEQVVPPYIKQFFDLKVHDGERIENWAFYCVLYREAIQKLKNEELYYKGINGETRLQGQRVTADKIEAWVTNEFFNRANRQTIQLDYQCYLDAMMGVLYKDAVRLLRDGYFNVLGAKETAEVIETWVKREFLKRRNII